MKKVYPRDQKERVLRKLLELGDGGDAPEGAITKLANAEGIPLNTLYTWNALSSSTKVILVFVPYANGSNPSSRSPWLLTSRGSS